MPLKDHFWQAIEPTDQIHFISCHPRSGSRWLRAIFSNMVAEQLGSDAFVLYSEKGSNFAPTTLDYIKGHVVINAHRCSTVLQSREPEIMPASIYRSHNLSQLIEPNRYKILYLYRDPVAVMVSFYHFIKETKTKSYTKNLKKFYQYKLKQWIEHLQLALDYHQSHPDKIHFIKYQDDSPFSIDQVVSAANFLELAFSKEAIVRAVDRFSEKLAKLNADPNNTHKRGTNTDADTHFKSRHLADIRAKTNHLLERADQIAFTTSQ